MNSPYTSNNEFITKLIKIIEENLSDEHFGVKELAEKINISREQMHRKLKASSHYSASQLIREIRLIKANDFLAKGVDTISEIAYKVGFSSPSYFIKCYHEFYGFSPGDYKKNNQNENTEIQPIQKLQSKQRTLNKKVYLAVGILVFVIVIVLLIPKRTSSDDHTKSIIVLPFKNLTNNINNEYIADGLTEEILNYLFWIGDLKVKSRTTSEHFKNSQLPANEIAKSANVNYLLEGSIRIQELRLRICVQLIDVRTDKHIWSKIFEREASDILGVQNEIAKEVAKQLKTIIIEDELIKIETLPTHNKEAYTLYLKGRFLLNKSNSTQRTDVDGKAMKTSLKYFEKAIELDPQFTQAYVELANAHCGLSGWGHTPGVNGWLIGDTIINKALTIDPNLGEAHAVKGAIYFWGGTRNLDAALEEFKIAVKLNPRYPRLYQWYAQLLMIIGPIEEARKCVDTALELEPFYWVTHNLSAYIYYFEEKYEESIEECKIAKEFYKDYIFNNWLFFLSYIKLNQGENAIKELQFILEANPKTKPFSSQIPLIYQKSGTNGLIKWIAEAQANSPVQVKGIGRSPYIIAWWYAILEDKENCLFWLDKLAQRKSIGYMPNLVVSNPDFDFLRNDPHFIELIEKFNLTKYHRRLQNPDSSKN